MSQFAALTLSGNIATGNHAALRLGVAPPPPPPTAPQLWAQVAATWPSVLGTVAVSSAMPWSSRGPLDAAVRARTGPTTATANDVMVPWTLRPALARSVQTPDQTPPAHAHQARAVWQLPTAYTDSPGARWRDASPGATSPRVRWYLPTPIDQPRATPWQNGAPAHRRVMLPFVRAVRHLQLPRARWTGATPVPWIITAPPPPPPPNPDPAQRGRYAALALACPLSLDGQHAALLLGRIRCAHTIPGQKVYHVINSCSVVRLPDRLPIQATRVSVSIDSGQALWDVSLDLADQASFDALQITGSPPAAREVEITINGHVWTAVIDEFDESSEFASPSRSCSGRSRAARFQEPYALERAYVSTEQRLARQLAEREIDGSGWTLDWTALDWLVPAGVWTYDGLTPLSAIQRIAEAVGAIVQCAPATNVLRVLPAYPAKPWDWDSHPVDVALSSDYTLSRASSFAGGVRAEGVIVRGESAGVQGNIKRAGTSGAIRAGVIVDALITTEAAATARAVHELSITGPIQSRTNEIPLFASADPGLVLPGALLLVDSVREVATGVRVVATRDDAQLTVRQTIATVRHLDFP